MSYFTEAILSALQLIIHFDPEIYQIAWTSIKISFIATLFASIFGILLGIVTAITRFPGKKLLQQCLNTLMAMPTVMIGLILYGILSRQGPLGELGLLYTQTAIILGETCLILPLIMNITLVTVQSADPRLITTLKILTARPYQQIIPILSELRFAILAGVITGFGRAIGEVGAAMMLGGNIQGHTRTMTTAIALETSKGDFEFGLALGLLLLFIAFVVNLMLQVVNTKE
ncbi:MAG: ABC transporter permease [Methylococcales symbiont of Iophon sp. n. MRB-2018]|nr:MAG: ABC transporter permease [Methylococcales symbiont of Iophon sp. n. MRB-2018]KAF3979114.1 MAG: ABC transporter permease [Methylococcales symbiont of Iophon sp. n. MRB-2018]